MASSPSRFPMSKIVMNGDVMTASFKSKSRWIVLSWLLFGHQIGITFAQEAKEDLANPATEQAEITFLGTLQQYYEQAKDAGTTTANSAGQWLGEQYEYATGGASKAANNTTGWLTKQYNNAVAAGETSATSAKDWVADDLGKIGTWQYKVMRLPAASRRLEIEMNKLGNQRWECFSVREVDSVYVVAYFKRPHRSYLKQLPAKDLLKLFPLLQDGNGDATE